MKWATANKRLGVWRFYEHILIDNNAQLQIHLTNEAQL